MGDAVGVHINVTLVQIGYCVLSSLSVLHTYRWSMRHQLRTLCSSIGGDIGNNGTTEYPGKTDDHGDNKEDDIHIYHPLLQ